MDIKLKKSNEESSPFSKETAKMSRKEKKAEKQAEKERAQAEKQSLKKAQKSKLYHKNTKIAAFLAMLVCVVVSFNTVLMVFDRTAAGEGSPLIYDSYFDTEAFNNQYSQLVRDVVNVNLAYKNEKYVSSGNALNEDLLLKSFAEEYGIDLSYMDILRFINSTQDAVYDTSSLDNMNAYNECKKLYDTYYPRYKKRAVSDQVADYRSSLKEVESFRNFGYYLVNEKTGKVISNMDLDVINGQKIKTVIDGPYIDGRYVSSSNYYYYYDDETRQTHSYYYNNYQDSIEKILQDNNYVLYAAVMDNLEPGDIFYSQYSAFQTKQEMLPVAVAVIGASTFLAVMLLFYLLGVAGRSERNGKVALLGIDKIYTDVQTGVVMLLCVISLLLFSGLWSQLYYISPDNTNLKFILEFSANILLVSDVILVSAYLTSMARQIKAKRLLHNSMVATVIRRIGSLFSGKTFKGWIVLCMFIYAVVNMFLAGLLFTVYSSISLLIVIAIIVGFNLMSAFMFTRALSSLTRIMVAVKETSKGNLNYKVDMSKISPSFINFANDVSGLQSGLKNAVEEAVKGERMKADLITNVSHDLKTPLTSIITYVDLLKKEEVNNPVAQGYVDILDEKSSRLKQLIEDLIEASKASSGNLPVNFGKVDLRQLVMQACGEFEEKINKAGLNFRINSVEETFVRADGKHMWRIVENLLSNAIKYSMSNTRVYIDIIRTESMGTMIIKNISAQPIDVTPDQLTERFVRGDESRTTEGSGLGLSIAKSLVALQEGAIEISIDGDLFKVCVKLPLWKEEPLEESDSIE